MRRKKMIYSKILNYDSIYQYDHDIYIYIYLITIIRWFIKMYSKLTTDLSSANKNSLD